MRKEGLRNRRYVLSAAVAFSLSAAGCAKYPQQKGIEEFGKATIAVSALANDVYSDSHKLVYAIADENAAHAYVSGAARFEPDYEALKFELDEEWTLRLKALQAIGAYAKELAAIGEPGSAAKAGAAASKLVAAGIEMAAALGNPMPAGMASGGPALTNGIVSLASNAFLVSRMRAVMRRTDPVLRKTVDLLVEDLKWLSPEPLRLASDLELARRDGLYLLRETGRATAWELRQAYFLNRAEKESTNVFVERLEGLPNALNKLAQAHHALLDSRDDERALAEFLDAAAKLATGLKALTAKGG